MRAIDAIIQIANPLLKNLPVSIVCVASNILGFDRIRLKPSDPLFTKRPSCNSEVGKISVIYSFDGSPLTLLHSGYSVSLRLRADQIICSARLEESTITDSILYCIDQSYWYQDKREGSVNYKGLMSALLLE